VIRFCTAGESHGRGIVAILEGVPAGLALAASDIDADLARRMLGHGRGAGVRMESDRVQILSGVRAGETLGSPIALLVENRDYLSWRDVMAVEPSVAAGRRRFLRPRPGHADLAGTLKYDRRDARDVLERESARETAGRVAAGAVCRRLLAEFGVEIGSHVVALGGVSAKLPGRLPEPLNDASDRSPVRCVDRRAEAAMVRAIDAAKSAGDTLGGVAEVVVRRLVVGVGSHVSWDRRLDARLAAAWMSIPAVKGVQIGLGFESARLRGSQAHDGIGLAAEGVSRRSGGFVRETNRSGGLEGGITTGEPLVARLGMKPLATLAKRPFPSVDIETGAAGPAQSERSDVTAVPAMGVIAEAMAALVLADAYAEKFGGDSLLEMRRNLDGYIAQLDARRAAWQGE